MTPLMLEKSAEKEDDTLSLREKKETLRIVLERGGRALGKEKGRGPMRMRFPT